jgi:hypothetical protein
VIQELGSGSYAYWSERMRTGIEPARELDPSPVLKFVSPRVGLCGPVHLVLPSTGFQGRSCYLVHLVRPRVGPSVYTAFAAMHADAEADVADLVEGPGVVS